MSRPAVRTDSRGDARAASGPFGRVSVSAFIVAAWTAFGFVSALLLRLGPGATATWTLALATRMASAWLWLGATPAIVAAARRIRREPTVRRRVVMHVLLGTTMVLANAVVLWLVGSAVQPAASSYSFWVRLWLTADASAVLYVVVVAFTGAWDRHAALAERERRTLSLQRALTRSRLLHLERQLRPHFLFNSLNAIAEMAHVSPQVAARMLAALSKLLGDALGHADQQEITLRDDLATLESFLTLQLVRFEGRLVVRHEVTSDTLEALIPPLLLQPVVENAIQHGVSGGDGHGVVVITASRVGDRLRLTVDDDGPADRSVPGGGSGIGLANTRDRLEAAYGADGFTLSLERAAGGTRALIELPFTANRAAMRHEAALEDRSTGASLPAIETAGGLEAEPWSLQKRMILIVSCCALAPLLWSTQIMLYLASLGRPLAFALSPSDAVAAAAWMVLGPLALLLGTRVPVRGATAARAAAFHVSCAMAASTLEGLAVYLSGFQGDRAIFAAANANQRLLGFSLYLVIVGWAHAGMFSAWYRARLASALRLEAELERARWQAAAAEVRPTLLLEALAAAKDQLAVSVDTADAIICELSALLRASLDGSRQPVVMPDAHATKEAATRRLEEMLATCAS